MLAAVRVTHVHPSSGTCWRSRAMQLGGMTYMCAVSAAGRCHVVPSHPRVPQVPPCYVSYQHILCGTPNRVASLRCWLCVAVHFFFAVSAGWLAIRQTACRYWHPASIVSLTRFCRLTHARVYHTWRTCLLWSPGAGVVFARPRFTRFAMQQHRSGYAALAPTQQPRDLCRVVSNSSWTAYSDRLYCVLGSRTGVCLHMPGRWAVSFMVPDMWYGVRHAAVCADNGLTRGTFSSVSRNLCKQTGLNRHSYPAISAAPLVLLRCFPPAQIDALPCSSKLSAPKQLPCPQASSPLAIEFCLLLRELEGPLRYACTFACRQQVKQEPICWLPGGGHPWTQVAVHCMLHAWTGYPHLPRKAPAACCVLPYAPGSPDAIRTSSGQPGEMRLVPHSMSAPYLGATSCRLTVQYTPLPSYQSSIILSK